MESSALPNSNKLKREEGPLNEEAISALESAFQDEIIENQESSPTLSVRVPKSITAIVLLLVISITGILVGYSALGSNSPTKNTEIGNLNLEGSQSSKSFNPLLNSVVEGKYSGIISTLQDVNSKPSREVTHELSGKDGKAVAFIYSENLDLNIALGMEVFIHGKPDNSGTKETVVINVTKLEFK